MSIYFLVLIIGSWPVKATANVLVNAHQVKVRSAEFCQSIANGNITDDSVVCDDGYTLHIERLQCTCSQDGPLSCADVTMECRKEQESCVVPASTWYTYMSLHGGRELRKDSKVPSGVSIRVVCLGGENAENDDIADYDDEQDGVIQCVDGYFTEHNLMCVTDGCLLPSPFEPQLAVYDPTQRRYISGDSVSHIRNTYSLLFNCERSGDTYYEPQRRSFTCDQGSWVVQQRDGDEPWNFENNGSFPMCRPVICPTGPNGPFCKFGGHCNRDFECECPAQTVGRNCEQPICLRACLNGGRCVKPNECQCSGGFQGRHCEQEPVKVQCSAIANGNITDRGKSVVCNSNHSLVFSSGMDGSLYQRYSCKCNQTSGNVSCMGSIVECKPNGCPLPKYLKPGFTLYDYTERQFISWANRYEIESGEVLNFNCEPSGGVYYEPRQRMFACYKGSWVGQQKPGEEPWKFENNGSFPECRTVKCPRNYCKFGGHCIRDLQCQCPQHSTGEYCEEALCGDGCLNGGSCIAPNTCACPAGYEGNHCQQAVCRWSCLNGGSCIAPDTCGCPAGYEGTRCQQSVCSGGCLNGGSCIGPDRCKCPHGYEGIRCHQAVCRSGCLNGGSCIAPGRCKCSVGYEGTRCQQAVCSGGCLNGGSCIAPDSCECVSGTRGKRCEKAMCSSDCFHGGSCIAPDTCKCPAAYEGEFCQQLKCPVGFCKNGGSCNQDFTCDCPEETKGKQCEDLDYDNY